MHPEAQQDALAGLLGQVGCGQDTLISYLGTHARHALVNNGIGSPIRPGAADICHEAAQQSAAAGRMAHFRVELHAEITPLQISQGSDGRVLAACQEEKTRRRGVDPIPVGHPDRV